MSEVEKLAELEVIYRQFDERFKVDNIGEKLYNSKEELLRLNLSEEYLEKVGRSYIPDPKLTFREFRAI
jgi:hypothetical protein